MAIELVHPGECTVDAFQGMVRNFKSQELHGLTTTSKSFQAPARYESGSIVELPCPEVLREIEVLKFCVMKSIFLQMSTRARALNKTHSLAKEAVESLI